MVCCDGVYFGDVCLECKHQQAVAQQGTFYRFHIFDGIKHAHLVPCKLVALLFVHIHLDGVGTTILAVGRNHSDGPCRQEANGVGGLQHQLWSCLKRH